MADLYKLEPGAPFAGDFRVVRPISAGGMGAVYEVEQTSTGKHRALKVMLPQLVADPALRKRFEQEARIASMIESEHVVEVVGAGVDPGSGVPWLAMELLLGEDLAKTVARRGALPVPEVLALYEQLCHAVGAAHRASIVHRDLKPENVFLAQSRRAGASFTVKVLDFGIAKIVAEAKTRQTAAMGSPIWMAPEQAERSPITPATDVWALGLVAFYLLTGRFFWKAANTDDATIPQLMREVLFEPIVPASMRTTELGTPLPAAFDGWFARCVAREPTARFADATQAWTALRPVLAGGSQDEAYLPTVQHPTYPPPGAAQPDAIRAAQQAPAPMQAPPTSPGMAPSPMMQPTGGAYGPPGGGGAAYGAAPVGTQPPAALAAPGYASGYGPPPAGTQPPAALAPRAGGATGSVATYTIPDQNGVPAFAPQPPSPSRSPLLMIAVGVVAAGVLAMGVFAALFLLRSQPGTVVAAATAGPAATAAPVADVPAAPDPALALLGGDAGAPGKTGLADLAPTAPSAPGAGSPPMTLPSAAAAAMGGPVTHPAVAVAPASPPAVAAPGAPPPPPAAPPPAGPAPAPHPGVVFVTPPAAAAPPAAAPAPAPAPAPAGQRSVADLVRSSVSADWPIARAQLEPKVMSGTATTDELRLLLENCKNMRDRPCEKMCIRQLKARGQRP